MERKCEEGVGAPLICTHTMLAYTPSLHSNTTPHLSLSSAQPTPLLLRLAFLHGLPPKAHQETPRSAMRCDDFIGFCSLTRQPCPEPRTAAHSCTQLHTAAHALSR